MGTGTPDRPTRMRNMWEMSCYESLETRTDL